MSDSTEFYQVKDSMKFRKKNFLLEWSAVILNLGFTFLYLKQNNWAFALGILAPMPISIISWNKKLFLPFSQI